WSLGEAQISGGTLRWHDASNSPAFTAKIGAIDARVKNLDGQGSVADFEAAWTVDGGERLKVDAFTIGEGKLDLAKRWVRLGEVRVDGARAAISRLADGRIEWIALPESEIERRTSASARTNVRPGKEKASSAGSWTVEIARSVGRKIALRFEDAATSPPSTQQIENLNVELSGVSSEPGRTAGVKMAFRLNRTGEVAVDGTLGVQPLDANLKVKARTVELPPLQAYLAEKLDVGVARGHTTFDGTLRLRQPAEKGGKNAREKADDTLTGGFAGSLTIGDFQATEKASAARGTAPPDLLRWKSLRLSRLDVRFGPESVAIGDITLADFFARIVVSPQGKLNLLELARADETAEANAGAVRAASSGGTATAPVAARDGPVLPVTIGKVALRGGSVRFTDNFVKPNYTANLQGIAGSVTGLSSRTGTQAALTLTGRYDRVAPLDVSARINPLSAEPYLDLRAEVKGIELTSLSTYAEKYAGYAIEKGKLSLFVKYRIENGQLEAENRVFLDQLTFGDAVDSPDATALPVRLAVALLKNRDGEIDVNLPVSGSLDDPQFSVGGLIVRVVVNLLAKAATSPFALIGAMFGDDEALSEVEFDAGRAALASEAAGRLENLAKALIDRPALKFEIEGWADPAQDGDGLKRVFLERRLRGLKYGDRSGQNTGSSAPAGPVEITKEEYPGLLERVYRAERFPKPRNEIGIERSLPVEEMERLILVNTPVGENDLKALGDRRARAVRDWLVARNVAGDRIFLLPSRIGAGEAGESGRRARFSLGER
ncbi:MAG: DUF748 domain-containing protein, partial [Candidatus Accumulibacter sp.]|nr:DUF748 domain-containing protein [Accumulibacter sp.]